MKRNAKNEKKAYSFEEYKRKYPSPANLKKAESLRTPHEVGVKLAEQSLAKVRRQIQQT